MPAQIFMPSDIMWASSAFFIKKMCAWQDQNCQKSVNIEANFVGGKI